MRGRVVVELDPRRLAEQRDEFVSAGLELGALGPEAACGNPSSPTNNPLLVRAVLRGFRVAVDERDVLMDAAFWRDL